VRRFISTRPFGPYIFSQTQNGHVDATRIVYVAQIMKNMSVSVDEMQQSTDNGGYKRAHCKYTI